MKLPDYTALGVAPEERPSTAVASEPDIGVVGRATAQLGDTTQKAASDTQTILNNAAVTDAMANQYQPKVRELAQNYYSLSGKDAIDAAPKFAADMAQARNDTASSLTGIAQQHFNAQALPVEDRELYRSAEHAGQQAQVYAKTSNDAALENHITDYSNNLISDPNTAADERKLALANDANFQKSIGAPPDVITYRQNNINDAFDKAQQGTIQQHLISLPADQQLALLKPLVHGTPVAGAPITAPTQQGDIVDTVMTHLEGSQLVQNDNGHGPSKYGIVGALNGLTPQQTADLTADQAKQIYINNYWKPAGIDNLPDNMKMVAFDTAVQFGVGTAKGMIAQANGDPQKLLDIRTSAYNNLVAQNPQKYGDSADSWQNRTATLSGMIGAPVAAGQPIENPKLFGVDVAPSTIPKLLQMAEATKSKEVRLQKDADESAQLQTQSDFVSKWSSNQLQPADVMASNLPPLGEGSKKFWLDQIAKGPDKVNPSDPAVIQQRGQLENMKVDDPQGFMKLDLSTMANKIPPGDISKFQSDQMNMRKGDSSIDAQNKQAKQVTDSISDMLPVAWKNPKTDDDEQAASGFKGNVITAVQQAQQSGGKPMGREDVRKVAADMLANVSIKGGVWDSTMPAYKVPAGTNPLTVYRGSPDNVYVPESFRNGFTRAWQTKYGKAPQETDVRAGFLKTASPATGTSASAPSPNMNQIESGYGN